MKVNYKKIMTAISATSIIALTMAASFTTNAADKTLKNAKIENKILVENVKQTAIAYSYNPDRTAVTIINNPSHMVTYVFPETVITGTYGTNIKGGIYERNNAPEVLQADDVVYLNAYNQVAGHAIKTTTVSVNR